MRPELLAYFTAHLPDPADAEDCVQRVFIRLLTKPIRPGSEHLARTVAGGILKNAYRDADAALSWDELIGPDGSGLDMLPQFQTPDADDAAFGEAFDQAVRGLDEELRDAYILGELRGLSGRQAAPLLGVSHVTANARREQATQTIRKEIAA